MRNTKIGRCIVGGLAAFLLALGVITAPPAAADTLWINTSGTTTGTWIYSGWFDPQTYNLLSDYTMDCDAGQGPEIFRFKIQRLSDGVWFYDTGNITGYDRWGTRGPWSAHQSIRYAWYSALTSVVAFKTFAGQAQALATTTAATCHYTLTAHG